MSDLRPAKLTQDGLDTLVIHWNDGTDGHIDVRRLRLACPCAECVDEWTGELRLAEETVPADVRPVRINPVGLYALSILWTDGHSTGIYTYEKLASLSQDAGQGETRQGEQS